MEYAKDEIFIVKHNTDNLIRKESTSQFFSMFRKNKMIKLIIGMTLVLCVVNFIYIYNFFSILSKI